MQYLPGISYKAYPDNEKPKLALLGNLFREWHQHFASNDSDLEKHVANDMVFDGFYPHYFSQKKRILFIGRETRWNSGKNYIDINYPRYRETKLIGSQPLNTDKFHSRMIYIAYGILYGMPTWQAIPDADKIGDTFGTPSGLSFAFMNISKLSNDTASWQTDAGVFNAAHRLSTEGRNFIQEEVAILEPHIVITMTMKVGGDKVASLGKLTPIHASNLAKSYWLDSGGHRSLLIETWHFSAWRKKDIPDYYDPICDAIRRSEAGIVEQTGGAQI
jgi:hypothetical protein